MISNFTIRKPIVSLKCRAACALWWDLGVADNLAADPFMISRGCRTIESWLTRPSRIILYPPDLSSIANNDNTLIKRGAARKSSVSRELSAKRACWDAITCLGKYLRARNLRSFSHANVPNII